MRTAGRTVAPAGRSECLESPGDQVLRQQRGSADPGRHAVVGGLLAVERGALLRGPERRGGPGSLRGPTIPGIETSSDDQRGQFLVPGANATGLGKKTRMANSTGIGQFSERYWLFRCAIREQM